MTFTREHHRVIAAALGSLNADLLRQYHCYFAGGTALAMRFGEYRESVDIDFLVADPQSFRGLRTTCRGPDGFAALTLPGQRVVVASAVRADQYGLRTRLTVVGVEVKLEIIHEGRITLDSPGPTDEVLGVATANLTDLVATKLLANSDRWADRSVFSRDIVDLAMVSPDHTTLRPAVDKATRAYGAAALDDAQTAITWLLTRDQVLERCRQALGMTVPRAVIAHRLRHLSGKLARVEKTLPD